MLLNLIYHAKCYRAVELTHEGQERIDPLLNKGYTCVDLRHKGGSHDKEWHINTIHELSAQGKSIREIARIVGIARNTMRRYLRGKPIAAPCPKRGSILDPYKEQSRRWICEDHLFNCEVMFSRLQAQGYPEGLSTIKAYVQSLRPAKVGQYPIQRYETKPGEQLQYDWAEFHYEKEGKHLHSWLNRNRRLIICWDKLTCTYLAFLCLANALLCFQQAAAFMLVRFLWLLKGLFWVFG